MWRMDVEGGVSSRLLPRSTPTDRPVPLGILPINIGLVYLSLKFRKEYNILLAPLPISYDTTLHHAHFFKHLLFVDDRCVCKTS